MAKKIIKSQSESISISKALGYKEHSIILIGIEKERQEQFNNMQSIEVSVDELNAIGKHRWLIKENEDGN